MFKHKYFFLILLFIPSFYSCSTKKAATSGTSTSKPASDYIVNYKDLAVNEMKRTGVPASITLAQGMIESDFGRSRLAVGGNNHFGIKCHSDWKGATITHHDDKRNECFRKYKKAEESFYDHSDFLRSGSRYSFLFSLEKTDYIGWSKGLKKAGYATNPDYANMLIRKIEEYSLWQYDAITGSVQKNKPDEAKPDPSVSQQKDSSKTEKKVSTVMEPGTSVSIVARVRENNRIQYIIVSEGETREKLEKEFKLLHWELPKYNELPGDFVPEPGQLLYLQPKREKAEAGKEFHILEAGESIYFVSQKYGVKLKNLIEMNRIESADNPMPGTKLWLRSVKPVM